MYFCNINDEFILLCGPLSESEYNLAISTEKLSVTDHSTIEMNQQFGSVGGESSAPGSFVDPFTKVVVEVCAIRGNQIQRDRLLGPSASIDLVLPDSHPPRQETVSIDYTCDDDDTITLASVSVGSRKNEEKQALTDELEQISSVLVDETHDGKVDMTHGRHGIHRALSRINSSMYIKGETPSVASSVVSISDDGDGLSAMISISDDGNQIEFQDQIENAEGGDINNSHAGNIVNMPNIVTTVIIKMLRKEIKHLKEMAVVDSQLISSLKARVYDDESTLASDTEYIKFMNKKLLSESSFAALMNDEFSSPNMFQSPIIEEEDYVSNSVNRPSKAPHLDVVIEENGKASSKSIIEDSELLKRNDDSESNQIRDDPVTDAGLLRVIRNLREEVNSYRGIIQDDSVVISALKAKLGLEDTDEIEIPGYIGVHSVRTSSPIETNTFTDQDKVSEELPQGVMRDTEQNETGDCGNTGGDGSGEQSLNNNDENNEVADLKHKIHILRNLMIQQASQVRELSKSLDDVMNGREPNLPQVKFAGDYQPDLDFEQFVAKISDTEDAKAELKKLYYCNQDQLSVIKGFEIQISSLQSDLSGTCMDLEREKETSFVALKEAREDLSAAQSSILKLNSQLEELKYRQDLKEMSIKNQLPLSSVEDDLKYRMARRIQSLIRIHLAKQRVMTLRLMIAAREANVLFALKYTTQGETGWYRGPDGSVFYFVLDGDSWILTCGPVSPLEYEEMVIKCGLALQSSQKALVRGNVLVKCNFELSNMGENTDLRGDLFMSAKTHKLYVSLSLDTVVVSDGSRIISDGGGSRTSNIIGSNSLVEDSNSLVAINGGMIADNQGSTTLPAEPTSSD